MKIQNFRSVLKVESLAAILFLVTIVFVIAFHCFQREYEVNAQSADWQSHAVDDRSVGGDSFVEDLSDKSRLKFAFETHDTQKDAYALFLMMPENLEATKDISWFQNITIKAHVEGPESEQFLFILRDKVKKLYSPDDSSSMKYNQTLIELTNKSQTITIPRASFHVPRWWVIEKAAKMSDTAPTFNHFTWIELAVCNPRKASSGTVVVDSISFAGPIVAPVDFYRGLFGIWFLLAVPLCTRFYLNSQKTRSIRRSRRLQEAQIESRSEKGQSKNVLPIDDTVEIEDHDLLTELPNRFGIRDEIEEAIQAVRKGEDQANVILLDVDDMKTFNVSQGEDAGDKLLQQIATIARAALPPGHSLARWEDDKFLILCLGQSRADSKELACEIRRQIENQTSSTCSFGVHQMNPINNFEEVFERASKCVEEAKFHGKNKVVLFNFRVPKLAPLTNFDTTPLILNPNTPTGETMGRAINSITSD